MVVIKAFGYLVKYLGSRRVVISLDSPVRLRDLVTLPENVLDRVIILINGSPGSLSSFIQDADEISLMPVISGG